MDDGVGSGLLKPRRDARARARFVAMPSGGGFLLYLQLHPPTDLREVLRDYGEEMVLPALELYIEGLMTDPTM